MRRKLSSFSQELDGETMALLLSYIYTGQVQDFSNVSVVDLFKAADRYVVNQSFNLFKAADRYVLNQSFILFKAADRYVLNQSFILFKAADRYGTVNFGLNQTFNLFKTSIGIVNLVKSIIHLNIL